MKKKKVIHKCILIKKICVNDKTVDSEIQILNNNPRYCRFTFIFCMFFW